MGKDAEMQKRSRTGELPSRSQRANKFNGNTSNNKSPECIMRPRPLGVKNAFAPMSMHNTTKIKRTIPLKLPEDMARVASEAAERAMGFY